MSVAAAPASERISAQRARVLGVLFLLLALGLLLLGVRAGGGEAASFELGKNANWLIPGSDESVTLPVRGWLYALTALLAFLGGVQLVRGFGRRTFVILGAVIGVFVFGGLIFSARGGSLNLISMLGASIRGAVPLCLGALSGVLCERSGVINIAIEGMFLTAAFTGVIVGSVVNNWMGLISAALVGGLLGWALAVLAIRYRVDQIVAGVVINIFAIGMTSFLSAQILQENQELNNAERFQPLNPPLLGDIPILGVVFRNNVFVYVMILMVIVVHIGLFKTRWGLRVRAVGEHPLAADTVGIRVLFQRYRNVVYGGMAAGLGGAFFTLSSAGRFDEGMTAGRGFIALAVMIFGRWTPIGALGAALVFGFAEALRITLGILDVGIPSQFLQMTPYLVTILVVAGLVGRARPPAADGQPYIKEA